MDNEHIDKQQTPGYSGRGGLTDKEIVMTALKPVPAPIMNAGELLTSAPYDQVRRCKMIINAIANGEWEDAAHYARNAADEGQGPEYWHWATGMRDLARFCDARAAIAKATGK